MVSKELVAASTRPLVLSILARGESYGYELIRQARERSNGELAWTEGMLYPVLHRLEAEELIEGFWKPAPSGRRRKYYRLREDGTRQLAAERRQWLAIHRVLELAWGGEPCLT